MISVDLFFLQNKNSARFEIVYVRVERGAKSLVQYFEN